MGGNWLRFFDESFGAARMTALRSPDQVMRLARMGASHPTRLSFMRVLLRGLARRLDGGPPLWEVDERWCRPRGLPRAGAGADLQPRRLRP
jgi:hypothetical protein